MCILSFQEAAICAPCSILSVSCTTFAVWMPKKMYRISVNFVRALPLTIGLTCGLLMLTILFGMLSRQSLLWKWLFCWRYILVMISKSPFSLDVSKLCAFSIGTFRLADLFHILVPLAHRLVTLLYPFPQQLRVRRIPHIALIAGGIHADRIQILHVWLPLFSQDVLQLLYLQFSGKLQHYVIQQFVVCQRTSRIYYHVAEHLVMDVAIQLFRQFWATQTHVHLQEHQCYFPLSCEV